MIGTELQALRKKHGWTQRQLGQLLGVTEIAVRRYEIGMRHISKPIERLCKILTDTRNEKWVHIFFAESP